VLFLDVPHVTMVGAWNIREPLIRLLDRILGPDDLVGIMTPAMAPTDLVLARKTDVIQSGLRERWPWGERGTVETNDREKLYWECYVTSAPDVYAEMIARRRERATLEALDELVRHLRDMREERKAIVTVTEGWLLYRRNEGLRTLRKDAAGNTEPVPRVDPITVGPDGRLTTKNVRGSEPFDRMECENDRLQLALIDDFQFTRDMIDEANRANTTFYAVDPRGLVVFDTPVGPDAPPPLELDHRMLVERQSNMQMLSTNTDGVAVMGSNDLDKGMQRIADDLTSYYLLGYYSTNGKPDGRFHEIKVRVKQPGVQVRARRGYRAATAEEVARARTAAATPVAAAASPVMRAIDGLSRVSPASRVYINAVPVGTAKTISQVWVAAELAPAREGAAPPTGADIDVTSQGTTESAHVDLAPGQRGFMTRVALPSPVEASSVDVRVRVRGGDAPATDSVTATMEAGLPRPLIFRRGPVTANRQQPAANYVFSRTERLHLEIPIEPQWNPLGARLLDKTGQPLAIPVTFGERTDVDGGRRWFTADVALAPLAPGDYAIEMSAKTAEGEQRSITAIRVTR
jgi:VWFA-related protein